MLLCVLPPFSPPVVGMLTGKRRKRGGNPVFIFDAFTKAKRTLEDQMHDAVSNDRQHGPPSPVGAAGAVGADGSPQAISRDRKSFMDPASRQRFNTQVSYAFQTSAMDRFADDRCMQTPLPRPLTLILARALSLSLSLTLTRYKQNDGGRLSDLLERLGCGYVADGMDDLTAFYHIPAVKFVHRVCVDVPARRPAACSPPMQPRQPDPAAPCP